MKQGILLTVTQIFKGLLQAFKKSFILVYSGLSQVVQTQAKIYQSVHEWMTQIAPSLGSLIDRMPKWIKNVFFVIPWLLACLITLNYFNVFDEKPVLKTVQDPNVVMVNADLHKLIVDGTAKVMPFVEELRASGRIDFNEFYLSRIGANVTGRVSEILVIPGQVVKVGDVLAKITSTELTQSQLAYLKARSASQLAEQAANRARILFREDVIALAELQKREAESISAKAEFKAANDQLRVQGMVQANIDRLAKSGGIESINHVIATIAGEIVERKINNGQVVQPSDALFTIANLNTLWAVAEVPETYSYLISKGQNASLMIPAIRQADIEGVITYVDSMINPQTRTVLMRMEITNKDRQIKPGMLATMVVQSKSVDKLVVPVSAIIREDNHDHVFVRLDDDRYRLVMVKLSSEGRGYRPVISGLYEGQEIALDGAYHLNTERKRQLNGG